MRILFQMPFPVYLRTYGSTIRLLADRGHRILLSYDRPQKRRDPLADAIEACEGIELVPPMPRAARRHEDAIAQLRVAADYVRYLDRRFAGSPYIRRRLDKYLRGPLRVLARAPYGFPFAPAAVRALLAVERHVPSDEGIERAIAAHSPDAVVVTPLIGRTGGSRQQTDTVKAARRLGIPVGAGVATWDHLTTKGTIKTPPDRVFVWNEIQRHDAAELHFIPADRVAVTGAQVFDGWFERAPSSSREDFLARMSLDRAHNYVLYVGSSPNISPAAIEIPFVRHWITRIRESGDPILQRLGVLVRPHPYNVEDWAGVDLADDAAAIAPRRQPGLPMTEDDEALYYDSIHFASAVVGINTTAMVESFIQRRPVLTIRAPEFRETQDGTIHFRHLLSAGGGAVQAASTLDEHLRQLRLAVEHPDHLHDAIESFLRTFVRPHGLDRPATPILADAIEELAGLGRAPARSRPEDSRPEQGVVEVRMNETDLNSRAHARGAKHEKSRREVKAAMQLASSPITGELTGCVAIESNDLVLVVPTEDSKRFSSSGETKEMRLLPRALKRLQAAGVDVSRATFIDAGANVGTVTLAALSAGFSSILACEPDPENFRLLRRNVALNGAEDRVCTLEVALSNEVGVGRLDLGHETRRESRVLTSKETPSTRLAEVRLARLDDLAANAVFDPAHVGLLWLDVEGFECHALLGASTLLDRGVPLVMELNVKLLRCAGTLDDLPALLARHYTHVLDLRRRGAEFSRVASVPELIAQYQPDRITDLLLCRLPPLR
jgi:FkbM family methyltransferase